MYPEQLNTCNLGNQRDVVNTGNWWNDNISEDDRVVAEDIGG